MKFINQFGAIATLTILGKVVRSIGALQDCDSLANIQVETCAATNSNIYCKNKDNDIIYSVVPNTDQTGCVASDNPISVENTSETLTEVNFFFDNDNVLIKTSGSVDSAYTCIYTNSVLGACSSEKFEDSSSSSLSQHRYYINHASDSLSGALVNYSSGGFSVVDGKNGSYYPGNNGLIKCSGDRCSNVSINISSGANVYYLSTLVGYIIKCSSSTECENVPVTSESYFQNNAAAAGESPYQLIYCNGSQCEGLTTTSGNYVDGNTGYIIECNGQPTCNVNSDVGNFYLSTNPNILIDCTGTSCENVQAKIGIYISSKDGGKFITCDSTSCNELSESEYKKIPLCEVESNKCSVVINNEGVAEANTLLPEGAYCTNSDKSILYYATGTIELQGSIVTTSSSNCIQASQTYYQYYYTVGSTIYHVDDGEVTQITAPGYYFINTNTNKLVTGSKIEDYNNPYVKLYKCNGVSCVVIPNPSSVTYIVDVSKRIFKYSGNTYTFAYDKDVLCAYSNNKCIPNTDLKSTEFCVTSAGELVIAVNDIEAKKSGDCYKSNNMSNEIFGYSSNLYKLNLYDATLIDSTGYYLVSVSTNSTTEYKEFSGKNQDIILYGCTVSSCSVKTPEEGVYYYDNISNYLVKYDSASSQWIFPSNNGYALVSVEPGEKYIRKFTIDSTSTNKVTLSDKVSDGYYYTTDNEMYECPNTEGTSCDLIDESMYVMTNDNELFYCNVDDDNLASTVCNKQSCVLGELYYIGGYHFRCVTGNIFNILSTKYCNTDELVVVNFPTAFSETYPSNVKNAVDEIAKNNNNTATVKAGSNHLTVIPGIFTNCTYDKEEKIASFDLVCIENYVVLDNEKEPQICSTAKLGFVGCNEDSENPDKCNPSSAMTIFLSKVAIAFAMLFLGFMLY
ncbi:hypothetical protein LY90DRAFT_667057 [Neocallimastix californiae]|jgi:hypothetical protein|uniref:Scaffoldin n=1 Tax=Neocallimastix californiae TaxID=1754190 RepID=A0A1Y2ENA8_9FUNG|nr:hypothetical protein LY90DRAFT_667057 [Neocallimastix californiae]|eukprot:ORY72716.1 hypothetical protein LY90DRAFT_667057 [Neocallimastix californiae]